MKLKDKDKVKIKIKIKIKIKEIQQDYYKIVSRTISCCLPYLPYYIDLT